MEFNARNKDYRLKTYSYEEKSLKLADPVFNKTLDYWRYYVSHYLIYGADFEDKVKTTNENTGTHDLKTGKPTDDTVQLDSRSPITRLMVCLFAQNDMQFHG